MCIVLYLLLFCNFKSYDMFTHNMLGVSSKYTSGDPCREY